MLKIKKVFSSLIVLCLIMTAMFTFYTSNSYASSIKYLNKAKYGVTYKYDLDGDGKKEKIKCKTSNKVDGCPKELDLYINGRLVKKYETLGIPVLSIYDFNRKDKSLDIIIQSDEEDGYVSTNILKYNKGKIKNYEYGGFLDSFNSNTGIIKMVSYGYPSKDYNSGFSNCIGDFAVKVPYKVNKTNINMILSNSYDVANNVREHKYKMKKQVVTYKNPTSKEKSFTLKKGEKMNVISLYKKGKYEYIRVKNSKNKYGYIKSQSKLIVSNPLFMYP